MLDEFAAWYLAQWRDVLPEAWRGAGADRAPVLAAIPDRLDAPTRFSLVIHEAGHDRALGTLAPGVTLASLLAGRPRPATVALRVPPGAVLSRDVTLPLAAERNPAIVLGFEMDRLTPFEAAELRWGFSILRRDRAGGRLHVRLSLVPRAAVDAALAALATLGLRATALEGLDAEGARRRIPFDADGARRLARDHALAIGAWSLVGVLALLAIAVPFLRQQASMNASAARIEALRPAMREADSIRARLLAATAGADVLAAASRDVGDPLATLASLTAALPDDTFVTDLTQTGRKVTINGQSASAASLIGVLSANPAWRNPVFAAPVTRLETTRTDLFSIRAEIASPTASAP